MGRNQTIALIIGMVVTAILMVTEVVGSFVLAIVIGTFVTVIIGAELNSLSRKAQNKYSSKFTKEDYFINEKTKDWVEKNVNSLNAIFKKIDKESKLTGIGGSQLAKHNYTLSYYFNSGLGYGKYNTWNLGNYSQYIIIKEICEARDDFSKDLEDINLSVDRYTGKDGMIINYKDKEVDLEKITALVTEFGLQTTKKRMIQNLAGLNIGIEYDGLNDFFDFFINQKDKELEDVYKSLNDFIVHYKNSF